MILQEKIRVLIAEDEELIRVGIAAKIKELDTDFEIIGEVSDGAAALEAVRQMSPQVVFTDIKMPVMDGMELIRNISLSYPTVKTVILSGYSDFTYTQRAIRYGVFNYLLKPVENEALRDVLNDLKSEIASSQHRQHRTVVYSANYAAHKSEDCRYALFAVCIGNLCYDSADEQFAKDCEQRQADIHWHSLLDDFYPGAVDWYLSDEEEKNQKLICFSVNANEQGAHETMAAELCNHLQRMCPGVSVNVCTSPYLFLHNDIWVCAQRMRNILKQKVVIAQSGLFLLETDGDLKKSDLLGIVKMRVNEQLRALIARQDVARIRAELQLIIKYMIDNRVPQTDMQKILLHILGMFEFSGANEAANMQQEVLRCLGNITRQDKIASEILNVLMSCIDAEERTLPENSATLAKQLVAYVDENYLTLENLEDVTQTFAYNYAYLSRLFKKESGFSMSRYVIGKRMDLAKRIIENNEALNISQVAAMSGYSDARYFSRIFKAYTRMTPTEYRDSVIFKG